MHKTLKILVQWPSNLDVKLPMYTVRKSKLPRFIFYIAKNYKGYENTTPFT